MDGPVAIIGSGGQLGTDLVRILQDRASIVPLPHTELDVTDEAAVTRAIAAHRPEVVINCAAFVRVDECEEQVDAAMRVNVMGAFYVARSCARAQVLGMYVSTDYVFDGTKDVPYTEDDTPAPVNMYGVTKLAGELAVQTVLPRHYIVRVAGLYGAAGSSGKGGNFIETIIRRARAGQPLRVVNDQITSPTYARDAAEAIAAIIRRRAPVGIYHVANAGECTWFEFARAALELGGMRAALEPTTSAAWGARARRPHRSSLASTRLAAAGIASPRPWRDALAAYLVEKGHRPS